MSGFNGSGVWIAPTPVTSGTVIQSSVYNSANADIAAGFNNVLTRDGQGVMAGVFKITDGTASLPGLAFNTESGSGIFRPSSGIVGFTAGGIESFRINSSGRIAIGSTVDDGTNKVQMTGATAINGGTLILRTSSLDGSGFIFSTTLNQGKIKFTASDSTERASIIGQDYGSGGGVLIFNTNNGGAVPTERVRIDQLGNVGIGATPAYRLHVAAPTLPAMFATTAAAGATYRSGLRLEGSGSTTGHVSAALEFSGSNPNAAIWSSRYASYGGDLVFGTQVPSGGAYTDPQERMRLDGYGNLGIGAPATTGYKLDVVGTVRSSGTEGTYGYRLINAAGNSGFSMNIGGAGGAAGGFLSSDGGPMWFVAGGVERLRISSGGAIGVSQSTPWGWSGGIASVDIASGGSFAANGAAAYVAGGCYFNGASWVRTNTAAPTLYSASGGTHNWYIGTAGTAGSGYAPSLVMNTTASSGLNITNGLSTTSGTFTQSVNAFSFNATSGSAGTAQLNPGGNSTFTGHVAFVASGGARQGYIGNSVTTGATDTGTLSYVAATHSFTGAIVASGNITAFSDQSLKKDVAPIADALAKVEQIAGVSYNRIDTGEAGIGFIAQELIKIIPELVTKNEGGLLSVAYGNMVAVLVEAVKELSAKVKTLEAR